MNLLVMETNFRKPSFSDEEVEGGVGVLFIMCVAICGFTGPSVEMNSGGG